MFGFSYKRILIVLLVLIFAYFAYIGKIDGVRFIDAVQNLVSGEITVSPLQ